MIWNTWLFTSQLASSVGYGKIGSACVAQVPYAQSIHSALTSW